MNIKFWKKSERGGIENPSVPLSPANIVGDSIVSMGFGGAKTKSGSSITPDTAWNYSAVYAAIRLLAETVAQLPLSLHQKTGADRNPAVDHPLYGMMHNNPSNMMTSFVWRETHMGHVLSWGNGYAYIEREHVTGRPKSLQLLSPKDTVVDTDRNGDLIYVTKINNREYTIDQNDILHIQSIGTDGVCGKSPITLHRETLGLSMRATEFGAEFFGNGASLGGILKHPGGLGKEGRAKLKSAWDKLKGSGYQGVAVLEEGMDYTRIGIPPDDAQFIETRKFQITEVARIFNIPPHMLRDLEKSAFNNMTEQSIEFLRFTMTPWLVRWEQELNRKLLTKNEIAEGYYFKFMTNGLLRGTQDARYEAYGKAINDGWLSRNEVREFEDLNPVDGLDEYLVPLNMIPSDQLGEDPDPEPRSIESYSPIIEMAICSLTAFDRRCLKDSGGDNDKLLYFYAKNGAGILDRSITPVLKTIDARNASGFLSDFAKAWGDYRADIDGELEATVLTDQLLKILGGNSEN